MEEEVTAIVIDNGSGSCKAGFAGDEQPKCIESMVVGRLKTPSIMHDQKEVFVGEEAMQKRALLNLESPIDNGIIKNWDDMEKIWQHTINNILKVSAEEHPILMTESPLNPKQNRERLTQIMFENFNVPCLYVSVQGVLSLYSSGRTSGVVVDSGEGISHAIPIYEGYAVPHAIQRIKIAGRQLTDFLRETVQRRIGSVPDVDILRDIKEKMCFVANNYDEAIKDSEETHAVDKTYDLPDGRKLKIQLGSERFRVPEVLFQPYTAGFEFEGLPKQAFDSAFKCDTEVRRELLQNIILTGGSTLFEGMAERMWQELHQIAPSSYKIKLLAPPERRFSAWLGGSILSSLSTFQTMWINKQEYDDSGPSIIHRKCF